MKTKLMILAFLAGGALMAQPRFYAGVGYGYGPGPVAIRVAPPAPLVSMQSRHPGLGIVGSAAIGIRSERAIPGVLDTGLVRPSSAPAGLPRAITAAFIITGIGAANSGTQTVPRFGAARVSQQVSLTTCPPACTRARLRRTN